MGYLQIVIGAAKAAIGAHVSLVRLFIAERDFSVAVRQDRTGGLPTGEADLAGVVAHGASPRGVRGLRHAAAVILAPFATPTSAVCERAREGTPELHAAGCPAGTMQALTALGLLVMVVRVRTDGQRDPQTITWLQVSPAIDFALAGHRSFIDVPRVSIHLAATRGHVDSDVLRAACAMATSSLGHPRGFLWLQARSMRVSMTLGRADDNGSGWNTAAKSPHMPRNAVLNCQDGSASCLPAIQWIRTNAASARGSIGPGTRI
ncbi:hypothetical protein LTR53_005690 [Teratosphaeriaceae sp. CCFEE 6253]|nr:hypothetical protein LTR53_005690 [Teratosphaeriaceae sp. CCFEE 6253]